MVDRPLKVVASVAGKMEAEIIRGMLQARGIEVVLSQESAATAYGISVGALARVDIMVPSDQAQSAESVLDEYFAGGAPDPPP